MTYKYKFTPAELESHFIVLGALLRKRMLNTSSGKLRTANAGEFQLVQHEVHEDVVTFKHINTRNHIQVRYENSAIILSVPCDKMTDFHHGEFDVQEVP